MPSANPLLVPRSTADNAAMIRSSKHTRRGFLFLPTLLIVAQPGPIQAGEPQAKEMPKPTHGVTYRTHFPLTENPISENGH